MKAIFCFLFMFYFCFDATGAVSKLKLGLNWKAEPEFGGFYAAQVEGLFKKEGLDVEILEGGAGTPTIQMVASGSIDFGIVSGDELLIARDRGQDLVALYAVYQTAPYMIMARASKGFKTLKDLFESGVTLSVVKGLPMMTFLENKYSFKKVKIVPYAGGIATFLHDENFAQQGFISSEPRLAEAQGVKVKTFLMADEGFNPYATVVVARAKLLKEKPEVAAKMIRAMRAGWTQYFKNADKTHAVINKLNPSIAIKDLNAMVPLEKKYMTSPTTDKHGLGAMEPSRWEALGKLLLDLKLISKVPASFSGIVVDLTKI
jgi:NitT/TauT family transport system substrate-binding protein